MLAGGDGACMDSRAPCLAWAVRVYFTAQAAPDMVSKYFPLFQITVKSTVSKASVHIAVSGNCPETGLRLLCLIIGSSTGTEDKGCEGK